jgi:4-alpha-glucanotransferase
VILQFAFSGEPHHPYLPENAHERQVIYPGTHDNDTTRGWYDKLEAHERLHVDAYFGGPLEDPARALVEAAWRARPNLAVAQLQDVLSLGTEARLNVPGQPEGNWTWRHTDPEALEAVADGLKRLTEESGRASAPA